MPYIWLQTAQIILYVMFNHIDTDLNWFVLSHFIYYADQYVIKPFILYFFSNFHYAYEPQCEKHSLVRIFKRKKSFLWTTSLGAHVRRYVAHSAAIFIIYKVMKYRELLMK